MHRNIPVVVHAESGGLCRSCVDRCGNRCGKPLITLARPNRILLPGLMYAAVQGVSEVTSWNSNCDHTIAHFLLVQWLATCVNSVRACHIDERRDNSS